jgi:hypothetical protein
MELISLHARRRELLALNPGVWVLGQSASLNFSASSVTNAAETLTRRGDIRAGLTGRLLLGGKTTLEQGRRSRIPEKAVGMYAPHGKGRDGRDE